jgi:hypothetical protein
MGYLVLIYKGESQYHWICFPEGMNVSSNVTKVETQQDEDFFPSEDVEIVVTGGMIQFVSKREKPVTLSFIGLSPKEQLGRVKKRAQQWKSDAVLRGVFANRWHFYADRQTGRLSTFEVTEWRFIFLAQGKIGSFVVSRDDVKLLPEENAAKQLGPDALLGAGILEDWKVDLAAAIRIAADTGGTVRDCPFLLVQSIDGDTAPVWTVPTGAAAVRINATSGQVLPLQDPTGSGDR